MSKGSCLIALAVCINNSKRLQTDTVTLLSERVTYALGGLGGAYSLQRFELGAQVSIVCRSIQQFDADFCLITKMNILNHPNKILKTG